MQTLVHKNWCAERQRANSTPLNRPNSKDNDRYQRARLAARSQSSKEKLGWRVQGDAKAQHLCCMFCRCCANGVQCRLDVSVATQEGLLSSMRTSTSFSTTPGGLPRCRPTRPALLARCLALAILATTLFVVPAASEAEASQNLSRCTYASARVLGWVWADGSYRTSSGDFFFRTKSGAVARHMEANLDELGLDYRQGKSKQGHDRFRIELPSYSKSFLLSNPLDHPATTCDPEAFLASVIESESNSNGLILDDPKSIRRTGVIDLLTSLDIKAVDQGFRIKAARTDWPKLRSLPFVACYRVPGGNTNCQLGQTR